MNTSAENGDDEDRTTSSIARRDEAEEVETPCIFPSVTVKCCSNTVDKFVFNPQDDTAIGQVMGLATT